MKQRKFAVVDRKNAIIGFVMAENIDDARKKAWYPLFNVFDQQEHEALLNDIFNRSLYNHFSWPIYHMWQMVIGEEAALDYMARCWAHEVADRIKHNQFTNWKGVN